MSLNALVPSSVGSQQDPAAKSVAGGATFQLGSTDYAGLCQTSKYDVLVGTATLAGGFKTVAITSVLGNTPNGGGAGIVGIPAARNAGCIFEGWLGSVQAAAPAAGAAAALEGAQFNGKLVIAGVAPAETNTLTIYATAVNGSLSATSTALVGFRIYVPKEGYY
jgi:hypothetical protein